LKKLLLLAVIVIASTSPLLLAQAAPPKAGKWLVHTERSKMDDSETVSVGVNADERVKGWLISATPTLLVRCQEKKLEVFIDLGMPASVERGGNLHMHHVRLRFDHNPATTQSWGESTDRKALFALGNTDMIVTKLATSKQLVFEFTPFSAAPAVVTFNVDGFPEQLQRLRKGCPARQKS